MAQLVKLLNHQAQFLQAPYLLNDIRFFILCGGFACGKTSSLVYAVTFAVKNLLGKKDKEGHNPRIMVGSKNITFLAKTWTDAFEQNLKMTGSNYHFDRAKNIITIGNVEIILVATEEPTNIYGYSCFEENTLIATSKGNIPIKDIKAGDLVFTTKGFKTVKNVKYMGEKPCMSVFVNGQEITCTTDHRFIDVFDNDIKAKDLTYMSSLVTLDEKEWKKWLFVSGLIEQSQKLLTLMALDITDTLKVNHMEKGVILPAQMKIRKKVSQLCTEICGLLSMAKYLKDMTYITKMGTALTTLLQTLNVLKEASILKSIGNCNKKKDYSRLLKHLKKHRKEIKSCIKKKNTEPSYLKRLRNQVNRNLSSVLVSSAKKSSLDTVENVMYVLQSAEGKKKEDNSRKGILQTLKSVFALFAERRLMYSNTQLLKLAHPLVKTTKEGEPYIKGVYRVYDIEVEDCHEYFANGVRVHNCVMSVIDELDELPTNIAMEAVKSVNDRVRQQIEGFRDPFVCFATTSQGLKGLYQTVMHFKKSGIGYFLLRARTRDNTYLPVEYVKNMYSIYNEKEVKCLLEGEFISIDSGLVFPDYNPAVNKLDEDLFDCLEDNDVVYIGQDFNCIQGDVLINTIKGKVKMKNLKEGDFVLTRKGYRKVLHKVCKGTKMVQDFNEGLVATADHIAITPEGEMELCRAKKFYCLKKQSTELLKNEREELIQLFKLKKLLSKGKSTEEYQKDVQVAQTIFGTERTAFIKIFMNIILEKLRKEIRYTTKTVSMITDLKTLYKLVIKNMHKNTLRKEVECTARKVKNLLNCTINQEKVSCVIQEFHKMLGLQEHTIVLLFVLIVEKLLMQKSEQQEDVQNVNISGTCTEKERLIESLIYTVSLVENLLQERVQLHIAQNTRVIGKELNTNKRARKAKVYDITVEDCHEFYANDILVHNCFGNHAVAFVVKKFDDGTSAIVAIKDYKLPDMRRAPEVFRYDFPTQKIVWIPDMTYKEHFIEFKKELRAFNITIAYRSCNPLVNDRVFACNKLFHAERLFICPICKDLETALLTHQRDPKTGMPMKGGETAPDHKSDCLGYAVHYLLSWNRDLKELYDVTLRYMYSKRKARGADSAELEPEDSLISADKIKAIPLKKANNVDKNNFNK